jgi:hypothetical protein
MARNTHYSRTVTGFAVMDIDFLEKLFNENLIPDSEECGVIEQLKSTRRFCGNFSQLLSN